MIKMKVNYDKKETEVYLYKLAVGIAFFSKRSGTDEIGLYMVVDRNSGIFLTAIEIISWRLILLLDRLEPLMEVKR